MKKKIVLYAIIFILLAGATKAVDIILKYEIGIGEYIRYSMPLTAEETNFLKKNVLQYGIDINDAPFAFIQEESLQNTGILVDYFNQLSLTLETDFEPVVYDSYNLAMSLKNNIVSFSVLNMTPVNTQVFLFTQPLYTERSKVLVDGESSFEKISDIHDMSIAVISGSTAHRAANRYFKVGNGVRLILTEDLEESFSLLSTGVVDAILGDEAKISYHLNQALKSNQYKFVEGTISEENVSVAVQKSDTMLYDILNKGILEMKKTNQFSHIHSKWFGSFIPEVSDPSDAGMNANVIIILLAVACAIMIWSLTVKNQVAVRTQELRESREEIRNIMDSLPDGIIVTNESDIVTVCNKSILKTLGIDFESVIGKRLNEIPNIEMFLAHENEPEGLEYKGKHLLVYHRRLNATSDEKLVVLEDYTERHKHETLNRQEAKMIAVGELSAGLAHEIRNPLGLIKSYLYILKKKNNDSIGEHAIEVMDDSVARINNLIENLLGFSRLSMEKAGEVNLCSSVSQILSLEKKNLEKNGIEISVDFDMPDGDNIIINEDVLKLAIVNLINNSIDAFSDTEDENCNKEIRIVIKMDNKKLHIDFADNGCGIPEENIEQIFNPFFTTKEQGTGLGLYIIDSEVRGAGGSIRVESHAGKGTTFLIQLPVELSNKEDLTYIKKMQTEREVKVIE